MSHAEENWSVGEAEADGKPIIYKFISEAPKENIRASLRWLTVVSWQYDGSTNNGLPPKDINDAMMTLEDGLETIEGHGSVYMNVYTSTGNGRKEFVYYIADRDVFMHNFNEALKDHPPYPLKIEFFEDKKWEDLATLHKNFGLTQ